MFRRKCSWAVRLFLSAVVVCLGLVSHVRAGESKKDVSAAVKKALTPEQKKKNIESFDLVWQTILDSHYDPKLGGADWQGARKELRPRLEKADSMDEARAVMDELLGRLGHTHVNIIPASLYEEVQGNPAEGKPAAAPHQGELGVDVRVANDEAIMVRVSKGLPAARAGVRTGWRIHKIDGDAVAPRMARIRANMKKADDVPFMQAMTVLGRLRGDQGQKITVTFLDGQDKEITLPLSLAAPEGKLVKFGQLPPMYVHFEARKVNDNVAYFYLNGFFDPFRVMKAFGDSVKENLNAEGFVLDLRGNPGGLGVMSQGIGGWFVDQPDLKLGTETDRKGFRDYVLNPREATYEGPLAILVDEFSASTSEILAGGLQSMKRARIFGTRTAGAALLSYFLQLPNGDRLQYVVADYVSADGKRLEGNGVEPDEVVPVDRKALLAGRDPTLDAAVKWIRSQQANRVEGKK